MKNIVPHIHHYLFFVILLGFLINVVKCRQIICNKPRHQQESRFKDKLFVRVHGRLPV